MNCKACKGPTGAFSVRIYYEGDRQGVYCPAQACLRVLATDLAQLQVTVARGGDVNEAMRLQPIEGVTFFRGHAVVTI